MPVKEIAVKKYVVRLSAEERTQLGSLIAKGKSPAQRLLKARILLKADVGDPSLRVRGLEGLMVAGQFPPDRSSRPAILTFDPLGGT